MVRQAVLVDAVLAAVLTALAVDTVVRTGADSWREQRGFAVTLRLPISEDGS